MGGTVKRGGVTRGRTTQPEVSQQVNIKDIFLNLPPEYGAVKNTFTPDEVQKYTAGQLYELVYGGEIDYWKSPKFQEYSIQEKDFVDELIRRVNVVESIYTCPVVSCGYKRILVRQEQIGGGDESMTTKYRCVKCGHTWSNSGRG